MDVKPIDIGRISCVLQELRMYNPDYLERPYIVVLNKIDLPEARDRLPSLVHEISAIGCPDVPSESERISEEAFQASHVESEDASKLPLGSLNKERKEKEIEEYPRPLAVVGVSVLKRIRINEMLKEIRSALRKCQDLDEAAERSTV